MKIVVPLILLTALFFGCAQNKITLSVKELSSTASVECTIRIETSISRIDTTVKGGQSIDVGYNGELKQICIFTSTISTRDTQEAQYMQPESFLAKDRSRYIVYFVPFDPAPLKIESQDDKITVPEVINFKGRYSKVVLLGEKCFQIVSTNSVMYLSKKVDQFNWKDAASDSEYVEIKNYRKPEEGHNSIFYRYILPEEMDDNFEKLGI